LSETSQINGWSERGVPCATKRGPRGEGRVAKRLKTQKGKEGTKGFRTGGAGETGGKGKREEKDKKKQAGEWAVNRGKPSSGRRRTGNDKYVIPVTRQEAHRDEGRDWVAPTHQLAREFGGKHPVESQLNASENAISAARVKRPLKRRWTWPYFMSGGKEDKRQKK